MTIRPKPTDDNLGDPHLYDDGEQRALYEVDVIALDEFAVPRVDLIKMDIQGAEAMAIAGMRTLFASNPGLQMFTEFWPHGLRGAGTDPAEFLRALRSVGFSLSLLDGQEHAIRDAEDEEILRSAPNIVSLNLLCTRNTPGRQH